MRFFVQRYKRARHALGTMVEISVESGNEIVAQEAIQLAFEEIQRLEKIFGRFDPESELSRLHQRTRGVPVEISRELEQVLELGAQLEAQFPECFRLMPECSHNGPCYELAPRSIRLPGPCSLDIGGLAKGYIVDRAFELLNRALPDSPLLINAGGDLRGQGSHIVEIRIPGRSGEHRYSITLRDGALATTSLLGSSSETPSPDGRRGGEFWRAQTASAAVVATSCAYADGFTKVALFSNAGAPDSVRALFRFNEWGEQVSHAL
jgi:thiamine biosynthesis lipoprotein ApbE